MSAELAFPGTTANNFHSDLIGQLYFMATLICKVAALCVGRATSSLITAGRLPRLGRMCVWCLACARYLVDTENMVALLLMLLEENETSGDLQISSIVIIKRMFLYM